MMFKAKYNVFDLFVVGFGVSIIESQGLATGLIFMVAGILISSVGEVVFK